MGVLSDGDIALEMDAGKLIITPFTEEHLQPASYEVCIGADWLWWSARSPIDTAKIKEATATMIPQHADTVTLKPGDFVLATTIETIHLPDHLNAKLEGKSSLGRLGLSIHATAGYIDPGFHGTITLEIANINRVPIILHAGMKIGQLVFSRLDSPARRPYGTPGLGSHYQNQSGVTAARQ